MRAHFATDIPMSPDNEIKSPPPTPSSQYEQNWSNEDKVDPNVLKSRVIAFKMDSNRMESLCSCIDEILQRAEKEVVKQKQDQQQMTQSDSDLQKNKTKSQRSNLTDINDKMGTMARVFVVRVFDTICNCANNAATAPISRFKFRGFKKQTTNVSSEPEIRTENVVRNGIDAVSGTEMLLDGDNETIEMTNSGKSDNSFTNKLKKSLSGLKEKKSEKLKHKLIAKNDVNIKEESKQAEKAKNLG